MKVSSVSQTVLSLPAGSIQELNATSFLAFPDNALHDSLTYPFYGAILSLVILGCHGFVSVVSKVLRLRGDLALSSPSSIKPRIASFESSEFVFYIARLLAALVLLGISAYDISSSLSNEVVLPAWGIVLTYAYASILGFFSVVLSPGRGDFIVHHLNSVLLFTFGVHFARNIFPLMTFTEEPKDLDRFPNLWVQLAVLAFACLFVPLFMPRRYVPVDPNEPMDELNPEQTASIASLTVYAFMDPVIWLGNKHPHLETSQLPTLADDDDSQNLKARSFTHLDFHSGAPRQHLFFGLMRVFRLEYTIMTGMIFIFVVGFFASPIAINQLLQYLENNGEGAYIRPWVWIIAIPLGPTISTLATQWSNFLETRTLVRAESIMTQLIFNHSLRIRMKAATEKSDALSPSSRQSRVATPDQASSSERNEQTLHSATLTEGETPTSLDETLSGSVSQSTQNPDEKSPHVPTSSTNNLVGKINNLVTSDLNNVGEASGFLFAALYIPLQVTFGVLFLYTLLGWSAFVGIGSMVLLVPLPAYAAKIIQDAQAVQMERSDARVQIITDVLNVLRMIKLFAWERKMKEKVDERRRDELACVQRRRILALVNGQLTFAIPCVAMFVTFSTYTAAMHQPLTASKVFASLSVFDMIRDHFFVVFNTAIEAMTGKVSLDRINNFLKSTELLDRYTEGNAITEESQGSNSEDDPFGLRNATFTWSVETDGSLTPSTKNFALRIDKELVFLKGKINLIVGPTGSGKSSLLLALLGEMHFVRTEPDSWFNLPAKKGVAYCPQEPFIENATIKNNILFGEPFDFNRYQEVIKQCALERDLSLFEAGEDTEIGEKGLTLSGGQKARVALARAIYSSKEIILLDDVLAALDVHTAKWVVDNCLSGDMIKERTVLLVTHHVALSRKIASYAVVMDINGRVESQGAPAEVFAHSKELAQEVAEDEAEVHRAEAEIDPQTEGAAVEKKTDGKLILAEEKAEGHITWAALKLYFKAMGGSFSGLFFLSVCGGMVASQAVNNLLTLWLGLFAREYAEHPNNPEDVAVYHYLNVYTLLLLLSILMFGLSEYIYIRGAIRASRILHTQLVETIFGATLRWLDTTPISRIMTRCTQDIQAIDTSMSSYLFIAVELTASLATKFVAVIIAAPSFLLPGTLVAIVGGLTGQVYINAQLSVKREMSAAKSPVLAHFSAAIAGLTSIRAYSAEGLFMAELQKRINRYTRAARTFYNLNRWICCRIDFISSIFAASLAAYLVYGKQGDPTKTGFTINMAIGFSSLILWWVHFLNEFEVSGNSLERIQEYVTIEQEPKSSPSGVPPAAWPMSGDLRVEGLSARYSPDGPKVLKDLSFNISSGQRVGIVGRTGSGKSSLTLALLRCIHTEGSVYYDGLRTQDMNLDALRSRITIIPQMVELLKGSLRENLDPFEAHDDAMLNDALRSAGLFTLQQSMEDGQLSLDSQISSSGGNLSVGQRQIIALARALLRGSKLLILDEATSAIDFNTDSIIQNSLRNELKSDMTLITIAHRLQTVFDFDRIMVLDAGVLVEFDSPLALIQKEESFLRALVDESPDRDILWRMAEGQKTK